MVEISSKFDDELAPFPMLKVPDPDDTPDPALIPIPALDDVGPLVGTWGP